MINWFSSLLLLITAVSALPSSRRDVNTVLTNLQAIDSQANSLTSSINSWDGSLLGALGIASASNSLESTIDDATSSAQTETQFSSADTQTVLTYVTGTLTPDTQAALSALVSRQSAVAALSLQSLVLSQVQTLQDSVAALSAALIGIASADLQASVQSAADALDASFDTAVSAYS